MSRRPRNGTFGPTTCAEVSLPSGGEMGTISIADRRLSGRTGCRSLLLVDVADPVVRPGEATLALFTGAPS